MRDIFRLSVVLTLICGLAAGALSTLKVSLAPKIEMQNDLNIRGPALAELFNEPAEKLLGNKIKFTIDEQTYPIFYTRQNGTISGLAIEAPGHGGYGGDVFIMIGIDLETQNLLGMEVVRHSETPGVGSQIEKDNFRKQWKNIPVSEKMDLRSAGGTIDAISGATYSSRAVMDGTNRILKLVEAHKNEILQQIQSGQG